ncbi:unnamed protein product [Rotaria magnacalcarata]|uniref:Uncharacterized protein n=1 Tax=Rotaria magnacalcarata TaxID=392030 RepID=A0A816VYJ6_9BILA|nr:unnamed protein product [Rotaria magnacalcarata]CAF1589335.1 unnamed protein product [Rotaria magnacalcarata]CAF2129441.1 unnamed protein product [Rotaria magnacalcarata]CAF4013615.1 unnamed protein product [Rotaria magnacalcarata]
MFITRNCNYSLLRVFIKKNYTYPFIRCLSSNTTDKLHEVGLLTAVKQEGNYETGQNKDNPLIQCEHVRFEHISIQLDAGASIPKQSKKAKDFQMKFNNLQERFLKKEMNCNQLLTGLSLLIGNKKN